MVVIVHYNRMLTDKAQTITKEEGLPRDVQSMIFTSVSSEVVSDIKISFNRGSDFFTVNSGQVLSISAQAGTLLEIFGGTPSSPDNMQLKAVTSGTLVEILLVA